MPTSSPCINLAAAQSASRLEATRATGGDATDEPFPALRGGPSDTLGRNKRSVGINLKDARGLELFRSLVAGADVLVEEMRPGTADRLGVGYEAMHELNPRLVYCSISGFGQDGPYASLPGHDLSYLAQAGALAMLTPRGGAPVIPQNIVADYAGGGLVAAVGVLAALLARQRTGLGQRVDAALTDGVLYVLADLLSSWFGFAVTPELGESAVSGALPSYSVYETRDGHHSPSRVSNRGSSAPSVMRSDAPSSRRSSRIPTAATSSAPSSPACSRRAPVTSGSRSSPRRTYRSAAFSGSKSSQPIRSCGRAT